ncbi:alpha-N-acetylglucosaminidase [Sulfuriroseicoccus oceanibius]|uniref:Alpha-N-acetylglucosaminidase n=1 Tax=Sulfuriroseicoccus oceanibius TaxID=2707525 RepID=A0A6B3LAF4_9BACT|nr:alpha-N-acetylglucosaminidase [Sulfuriroseicoccus oceanibius]QQL44102.1 alpha-N-acetylglucosaminidase [Sulfuriroseicoccus oceanibius]
MKPILQLVIPILALTATGLADDTSLLEMVKRVHPDHAESIEFRSIPATDGKSGFTISAADGKIQLAGSDTSAKAAAYGWYLKHVSRSHLSWSGDHLRAGAPLPDEPISQSSPYRHRFAFNYCTLSYTMAFWDWERWEREIDYLAINGYTHALVTAGLEKVWQQTLHELGYPEEKTRDCIANPAFAAWWHMGNLEGHGGPLSQGLIDREAELGRKIVKRMRELGITPVHQGFVGLLPNGIDEHVEGLTLVPQGHWVGGFRRPTVLDPTTDAFQKIAEVWYRNLEDVYGARGEAFGGDLFHEGGSHGNINVKAAAKSVQHAMQTASPDSTWVLQCWHHNPSDQLISGTNPQHTVVLQLSRNMRDGNNGAPLRTFQGRPWLWAELANFGGNHNLYGGNPLVASLPSLLLNENRPLGDMAGLALLSEGVETNPFYYSLFFDAGWRAQDIDLQRWIPAYAERRYGSAHPSAVAALELLNRSVYSPEGIQEGCTESILCAKPRRDANKASTWATGRISYDPMDVVHAAQQLLDAAPELSDQATYRYDLVDTTRQVLADLARPILAQTMEAYDREDIASFDLYSQRFLDLIRDTDSLLASDHHWLLGTWLERAKAKGHTLEEKRLMESAARKLITTWSNQSDALDDYSHRQWSGLMKDYYLVRWQTFFDVHGEVLAGHRSPDSLVGWYPELQQATDLKFAHLTKTYPTHATGDPVQVATRLMEKYGPLAEFLWTAHQHRDGLPWKLDHTGILSWDVSDAITEAGTHTVTLEWTSGAHALEIESVELYEGDRLVAQDRHTGQTGWQHKDNRYTLDLKKLRTNLDAYTLKAKVRGVGGGDSAGTLKICRD